MVSFHDDYIWTYGWGRKFHSPDSLSTISTAINMSTPMLYYKDFLVPVFRKWYMAVIPEKATTKKKVPIVLSKPRKCYIRGMNMNKP